MKKLTTTFEKLEKKLLSQGGKSVQYVDDRDFHRLLYQKGRFFDGLKVEFREGYPNMCHYNCSKFWKENGGHCNIVNGYVLNSQELWIPHTWIVKPINMLLIECTALNGETQKYFGYILNQEQCANFYSLYVKDIVHFNKYKEGRKNNTIPKDMTFAGWMRECFGGNIRK